MVKEAIDAAKGDRDIVKQKYCAEYFQISVNTLKDWVLHGCPEIRLDSGMVLYSKKAIREWLLMYQK
ncbi:MAG: DNA-binding protein [Enterococcus durans]